MVAHTQVCPRCGSQLSSISRIVRRSGKSAREYYIAIHYDPASKRTRSCYLGPLEYRAASKLHSELALGRVPIQLKGPLDRERILEYLGGILEQLSCTLDPGLRSRAIQMLEKALNQLRSGVTQP